MDLVVARGLCVHMPAVPVMSSGHSTCMHGDRRSAAAARAGGGERRACIYRSAWYVLGTSLSEAGFVGSRLIWRLLAWAEGMQCHINSPWLMADG